MPPGMEQWILRRIGVECTCTCCVGDPVLGLYESKIIQIGIESKRKIQDEFCLGDLIGPI